MDAWVRIPGQVSREIRDGEGGTWIRSDREDESTAIRHFHDFGTFLLVMNLHRTL